MSRQTRRLFLAGSTALAACSPSASGPGKGTDRKVHVYSSRHYDADKAVYDLFSREKRIEVRVLPAQGDQLIERLRQEGNQTEADLIVTVDGGNLWRLSEGGLLQAVTTPALEAAVPSRFRDPQGRWWAFSKRIRVIVYRKDAVDPSTLGSVDDLAQPPFAGQICMRSSTNTYNLSMLAARIEQSGRDNALAWARGMKNNFARPPQGGDLDQVRAVAAGECQAAIVNHYYLLRLRTSSDPAERAIADKVGVIVPEQRGRGVHVNICGAGVSAHARRKAEAVELLEFLLSARAQRMFAELNNEFPIRPDATLTPALGDLGRFHEEQIPFDALGRRQPEAARAYEEAGWL